jgi:hypothetical protein
MITIRELEWVAGFLEGEGCFLYVGRGVIIDVHQVNREPLDRLQRAFGGHIRFEDRRQKRPKHSPIYAWRLHRGAAGLMMTLFPLMSLERRAQMRRALDMWRSIPRPGEYNRKKTHCRHGHPLEGRSKLQRFCLVCRKDVLARYYQRKRLRAGGM